MSGHAVENMTCALATSGPEANFLSLTIPFYFATRKNLVGGVPDAVLSLVAHHIVYWILSLAFDILDHSGWTWLDKNRVYEPEG